MLEEAMKIHGSNGLDNNPLLEISNGMDTGNGCTRSYFGNSISISYSSCGAIEASHRLDNSASPVSSQSNSTNICSSNVPYNNDLTPAEIQFLSNKTCDSTQSCLGTSIVTRENPTVSSVSVTLHSSNTTDV